MRHEQFEFVDERRGAFARLTWSNGSTTFDVVLTEWPASLLSMWRADVLGPKARREAEAIARGEDQGSALPTTP